ncbi:MAG: hypothetical protein WCL13_04050 [bacterium]
MQIDKPFLEKDDDDGNKNISILGKVGGGVHGQASRLGVGLKQTQSRVSALDLNSSKPFINSGTQKMPSSGDRPIGL